MQYRETDFNFVSRLMEQVGIYYYFDHEDGKHTLVLADSISSHEPFPKYETVSYVPPGRIAEDREHLSEWAVEKTVQPGACALNDFNYEKPKSALETRSQVSREHAAAEFEVYDYPGEYGEYDHGETLSRLRVEEFHARHETARGTGDVRGIKVGATFELAEHFRDDQNREYLVTSSTCTLANDAFDSARAVRDAGSTFAVSFCAVRSEQPFRTARTTPKPIVQGPQTAIIVGKSGEEIWTDELGRVKAQFHWDRYGKADENSSCWIRVAQFWAGKNWGAMFLPRIGQEVVVEFLEGDPDRPLITGRVYNGESKPPYALPDNATMSTIKSNSSKGGEGFNEIRFEDKKDEEQIFIHAQKNQDIRVENDSYEWVGHDTHLVVKNDQVEQIENDRQETVDRDHVEEIGRDRHLKVSGKEAVEIAESQSTKVGGDVAEVYESNHSEQTTGDYYVSAENIVIEGSSNITLKVGQSYIAIEAGGIKIGTVGSLETESTGETALKGTSGVKIESPATAELTSTSTTVNGDAMLTVSGGLVKIN